MIVLDIETSGLYPEKYGIWQIGALDFYNPENTFLEEARIDEGDEVAEEALKLTGKTVAYERDPNKQSQRELLENFFSWTKSVKIKNCLCQNPQFDMDFINFKARKYSLETPFYHRAFDLHSTAASRYYQLNRKFLIEKDHSGMSLTNILKFCGLEDNRKAHNALEDAKLTAECFSRIINGKSLYQEYSSYKISEYLKQ